MTLTTDSQQLAGAANASDGPPYPDIADVSHATAEAAGFFRSYFTAKTSKDIEATHAHFHPDKTAYFDATLGWGWTTNADLRKVWEEYMPGWTAAARSYPTQILGDMTSAVVFMTDTPELFGGEIRAIAVVDMEAGKVVRWVDYWDGRGFGNIDLLASMRVPDDSYPHELGASTVTGRAGRIAEAAHALNAALAAGDPSAPVGCSPMTRGLRTCRCGPTSAARRRSSATSSAPCPTYLTLRHPSGTSSAPTRAADTNGTQRAVQCPAARQRSSSARTAGSPNSPSYGTAPCSTT